MYDAVTSVGKELTLGSSCWSVHRCRRVVPFSPSSSPLLHPTILQAHSTQPKHNQVIMSLPPLVSMPPVLTPAPAAQH